MNKFVQNTIRYRVLILIGIGLLTATLGYFLQFLSIDSDLLKFLPDDNPKVSLFKRVNQRFGGLNVAIVGLEADTLFTSARLTDIREMTISFSEIEGVHNVLSFTEAPDPRPNEYGLSVEPLVDTIPRDRQGLENLRKQVLSSETAVGNLISNDGKAATILCFLGGKRPGTDIAEEIKQKALAKWKGEGKEVFFAGSPFISLDLMSGTKEDSLRLVPIMSLIIVAVTFVVFRSFVGMVLSLGVIGIATVWLMGLLAFSGKGVSVLDLSIPALLIAVGGAYSIQILSAYFNGKAPTVNERIAKAIRQTAASIVASTLATCAVLMSFLPADVGPLRKFAILTALGMLFTGTLALTVIPAVLSFSRVVPKRAADSIFARLAAAIYGFAISNRLLTIVAAAILFAAGATCATRITTGSAFDSFFAKGSDTDKANRFFNRNFKGSTYLQIYFEGDMRSPFVLFELRKIVETASKMDEVAQVSSIIEPLVMMSKAMSGRADLPLTRERTISLYPFLDGSSAVNQIMTPEKNAALVQIRLKDLSASQIALAVKTLEGFIASEVRTGIKSVVVADLSSSERKALDLYRSEEIAKRIIRLADSHLGLSLKRKTIEHISFMLRDPSLKALSLGPDVEQEAAKIVEEQIESEDCPLQEPEPGALNEALYEWTERKELALAALAPIIIKNPNLHDVREALKKALPKTALRDPEGVDLVASAVMPGLSQAYSAIWTSRLVGTVFDALGIKEPGELLRTKVALAMSEMDSPEYGILDSSSKADKISVSVTGQPVIDAAASKSALNNQVKLTLAALVLLLAVLAITFRSFKISVTGFVVPILTLAVTTIVMGVAGIPIDMTTSLITAIGLGVAVNYSIQFLYSHRKEENLGDTICMVGPSIGANAFQVASGFAVFIFSNTATMQRFGMLVSVVMLFGFVSVFAFLPAIIRKKI